MNIRGKSMTTAVFFLVLLAGICRTEAGNAFEPWEGKATTSLNVRDSPSPGSQVTAWLKKGQKVIVKDVIIIENEKNWYKVVFKGKSYGEGKGEGFGEGWVHGGYIRRLSAEKAEGSSALAKVRAEIALETSKAETLLDGSARKDHLPRGIANEMTPSPPSETILVLREKARMDPQTSPLSEKKNATPSPPSKTPSLLREEARMGPQTSPLGGNKEVALSPPATGTVIKEQADLSSRTTGPVVGESVKQKPPVLNDSRDLNDTKAPKTLAELALRLVSVTFSCLAILLSYKAIKLAKISYNAAMQLQHDLQIWHQRENKEVG